MKRTYTRLLALVTALVLTLGLSGGALAAEAGTAPKDIAVQLNGSNLSFTDAAPEAVNGRTFLPLRAVFEALGATVDYNPTSQTVTATRGDTTVSMVLGGTVATVTKGGVSTALTMDVAPYARDNRTYVPVRFAAQALGCAVGWDADDSTVILIDTETLLADALAKHSFTHMEQYAAYSEKFSSGNWAMRADFDASVAMLGLPAMLVNGDMTGISGGSDKMEAAMTMKMDMKDFLLGMMAAMGQPQELTAADQALMDALSKSGIGMEARIDMASGVMYILFTGDFMAAAGIPAGTWLSFDLNKLLSASSIDLSALLDASKAMSADALLSTMLASIPLSDKDADYTTISGVIGGVAKFLSDESFVKTGNKAVSTFSITQNGGTFAASLTLILDGERVVGYDMDFSFTMTSKNPSGESIVTTMGYKLGMDEKNHMTADMSMEMPGLMDMGMTMTGDYTATDKTPQTQPPKGAPVVSYESLLLPAA